MDTRHLPALFLAVALPLAACGGGGGGTAPPAGSGDPESSYVRLTTTRLDGGTATSFDFAADVRGPEVPTALSWDLGDGRVESGPMVSVVYTSPGVYTVALTADYADSTSSTASVDVTVFDPQGGDVLAGTDIPMPARLGDVDGDLLLTQLDVGIVQDHVDGTAALDGAGLRAADYHLDGVVDQLDVVLLANAVAAGGVLPDSIDPATGPRGTMVQVMSDALRDMNALVQVRVGSAPLRPLRRLHPGYGLFLMPMDAVGPATAAPILEGNVPVELVVDGTTVHTFDFDLVNPPAVTGDEISVLRSAGHDLEIAAANLELLMSSSFEALGTNADDRVLLRALLSAAAADFAQVAADLDALTADLTAEQREGLAYMVQVADLRGARASAQSSGLTTGLWHDGMGRGGAGSRSVDLVVGIGAVLDLAQAMNDTVQAPCLAASGGLPLSAFWTGPWGLAAASSLLSACSSLDTGAFVVSAIEALWPRMRGDLELSATLVPGVSPTSYDIAVKAPFARGALCGTSVGMAEIVQGLILQRLTSRLTVLASFGILQRIPFDQRSGFLRQVLVDLVRGFIDGVGATVGYALDAAGITQELERLKAQVCQAIGHDTSISISKLELGAAEVIPSDGGGLSSAGGGLVLRFACGTSGVTSVQIRATLPVAASPHFAGSTTVTCDGGTCPSGYPTPPGMVAIPAGTFLMGSNATSGFPYYAQPEERPVHQVTISSCFWMGQHEVTQAEYQAVMGTNPSGFPGASRPVERVTWADARAYCAALTAQNGGSVPPGYEYRLPTEAEWEYACRAGTTTEFHYGAALSCNQARFLYSDHSNSSCVSDGTVSVGGYAPNAFGLHDMHGNVWEWCLDSYTGSGYSSQATTDPFVTGGSYRVIRGGGWYYGSSACRSAVRGGVVHGYQDDDFGFRVVLAPVLVP